jgi:putative sigma-54 modulation protein
VTLPPAFKTLIQSKLARLGRVLPQILDAKVVCTGEKFRRSVRITLRARRRTFASEATADDLTSAFDEAVEALRRQTREAKERRTVSKGRSGSSRGASEGWGAAVRGERTPSPPLASDIVPRQLPTKPMSVDEARMQLEASDDQFLVFRNALSGEVNVLYRRRAGGLGLIEPVA